MNKYLIIQSFEGVMTSRRIEGVVESSLPIKEFCEESLDRILEREGVHQDFEGEEFEEFKERCLIIPATPLETCWKVGISDYELYHIYPFNKY